MYTPFESERSDFYEVFFLFFFFFGIAPHRVRSSMKKSIRKTAPSPPASTDVLRVVSEEREEHVPAAEPAAKPKYSSDESSDEDEEDTRMLEGNVYTKSGVEVI